MKRRCSLRALALFAFAVVIFILGGAIYHNTTSGSALGELGFWLYLPAPLIAATAALINNVDVRHGRSLADRSPGSRH